MTKVTLLLVCILATLQVYTNSLHLTKKDLDNVARFIESSRHITRVRRQALTDPQPWFGPPGMKIALKVPIPTNIGHFPGGNKTIADSCSRDKVEMNDGSCEAPLTTGKCATNEEVILDPETNKGICVPRLCPPDRVFVHITQLCHDPLDMDICPTGRELYYSAHGTPVCMCPDGTIEGDDDFDDDVCELVLGTSTQCAPGQVFWFSTFNSPPGCMPDPCNGQNLNRNPNELPFVPSTDGMCYKLGSSSGVCPDDKYFSLSYESLTGKCVTLEDAGYVVFDTKTRNELKTYFSTAETSGGVQIYANISQTGFDQDLPFGNNEQNNFPLFQNVQPSFVSTPQVNNFNADSPNNVDMVRNNQAGGNMQSFNNGLAQNGNIPSFSNNEPSQPADSVPSTNTNEIGIQSQTSPQETQFSPGNQNNNNGNTFASDNANQNNQRNPDDNLNFQNQFNQQQTGFQSPIRNQQTPNVQGQANNVDRNSNQQFQANAQNPPSSFNQQQPGSQQFQSNIFLNNNQKPHMNNQQRQPNNRDSQPNQSNNNNFSPEDFQSQSQSFNQQQNFQQNGSPSFNQDQNTNNGNRQFQSFNNGNRQTQTSNFNNNRQQQFSNQNNRQQIENDQRFQSQNGQHNNFNSEQQGSFGDQQSGSHQRGNQQPVSIEVGGPGFNSPEIQGGNNQQSFEMYDQYYGMRLARSLGVREAPIRLQLRAQYEVLENGVIHHYPVKRSVSMDLNNADLCTDSCAPSKKLSRKKRSTLPYASPSNVFETRLLGCRPGAVRDINAKCRNTILPARIPKRRGTRGAPPIPPTPSCGPNMAFNIRRKCVPSTTAQNSIVAFNLG